MLVGFAFYAFLAGNRYQRRSEVQLEMENDALLTLRTLTGELSESHFRSVAQPAPGLIVFPLPRDPQGNLSTDTSGRVTWAKTVCFRLTSLEGEPYLLKQEQVLPAASATVPDPLALNPPHDEAFWVAHGQGRKLARGATTLELTHVPTSPNRGLLQLRLELIRKMDNRTYRLETQTAVYPRN
jgi:hypothetical protein